MANFTKRAIAGAFWELLDEKPIDKITVTELCGRLGISRNTFYYHFGDVYDVVEELFLQEEARLVATSADIATIEQGLREATRLAAENQRAVRHLYESTERDRLMRYLHRAAQVSMSSLVETRAAGTGAANDDVDAIAYLYACMIEGIVADVMRSGGDRDIDAIIAQACRHLEGTVNLALANAAARGV